MINLTPWGNPQQTNAGAEQPSVFGQPETVVPPAVEQAKIVDKSVQLVHVGEGAVTAAQQAAEVSQPLAPETQPMITAVPENLAATPAPSVEAAAPQQLITEVPASLAPQPLQQQPPQPGQFQ